MSLEEELKDVHDLRRQHSMDREMVLDRPVTVFVHRYTCGVNSTTHRMMPGQQRASASGTACLMPWPRPGSRHSAGSPGPSSGQE